MRFSARAVRARVIAALNQSMTSDDQLILTSRTKEYVRAVESGRDVLTAAAVVEPEPLTPAAAVAYLRASLQPPPGPEWQRVLSALEVPEPPAVLAAVVSTPLGLWLLRAACGTREADPKSLLDSERFPTVEALRGRLFDLLIPALIRARPPSDDPGHLFRPHRRHDPAKVRQWLTTLAYYLDHTPAGDRLYAFNEQDPGTRDLRWWRLAIVALPRRVLPLASVLLGVIGGAIAGAIAGLGIEAGALPGGTSGVNVLEGALGLGFVGGLGGLLAAKVANEAIEHSPVFADLRAPEQQRRLVRYLLAGGFAAGPAFGLFWAVLSWLGYQIWKAAAGTVPPKWAGSGFVEGLKGGLFSGVVLGIIGAFAVWAYTPSPAIQASSPYVSWRAERDVAIVKLVGFTLVGAFLGAYVGLVGGKPDQGVYHALF